MRVYLPTIKAIKESKDVTIHEADILEDDKEHNVQVKIPVNDDVTHNHTIEEDDDCEPINEQVSDKQILRCSQRQRRPPERYEAHWAAIEEPKTYVEAVTGTDRLQWERAIKEELLAHEENRIWTIVEDLGQKTITSKWVFKIQEHKGGRRYKVSCCERI